jgi:hypothetical protein
VTWEERMKEVNMGCREKKVIPLGGRGMRKLEVWGSEG